MTYSIAGIKINGPALYMFHNWLRGYNTIHGTRFKPRESTRTMVKEFMRVSDGGKSWDWKAEQVERIKEVAA